jgi:hypothetical protein
LRYTPSFNRQAVPLRKHYLAASATSAAAERDLAYFLFESFCNTVPGHLFSTKSVDKSVGKLFTRPSSAVVVVFVTDWLKSNQSNIYYKYHNVTAIM